MGLNPTLATECVQAQNGNVRKVAIQIVRFHTVDVWIGVYPTYRGRGSHSPLNQKMEIKMDDKQTIEFIEKAKKQIRNLEREVAEAEKYLKNKYKYHECSNCGFRFKEEDKHDEETCKYINR